MKYFNYSIIAVVAIAIVGGFFVVGSPSVQRLKKLDETRISDLQNIQNEIIYYWQSKEKLPEKLEDLTNSVSGYKAPNDPETNLPYEYMIKDKQSFELCGMFALSLDVAATEPRATERFEPAPVSPKGGVGLDWNWSHPAGRSCFPRVIDPDYYPFFSKIKN